MDGKVPVLGSFLLRGRNSVTQQRTRSPRKGENRVYVVETELGGEEERRQRRIPNRAFTHPPVRRPRLHRRWLRSRLLHTLSSPSEGRFRIASVDCSTPPRSK